MDATLFFFGFDWFDSSSCLEDQEITWSVNENSEFSKWAQIAICIFSPSEY